MVSKASDDFPLPLGPVTTVNFPSARSRSIPLRLFWRAPRISTQPRSAGAVTQFLASTSEPTGNYRLGACDVQEFQGDRTYLAGSPRQLAVMFFEGVRQDAELKTLEGLRSQSVALRLYCYRQGVPLLPRGETRSRASCARRSVSL